MKYLTIFILAGCSTEVNLYQCHTTTTLDYIEAVDMDDAIKHFQLAHPKFTQYDCKYVDQTGDQK